MVKANVEIGRQKQRQALHFLFMLHKNRCPEHATECGACDGTGYVPLDYVRLEVEDAHYQIWKDATGRWRWAMTEAKYPYDEIGVGSHGGGHSLNNCMRRCVNHYTHDIIGLDRE